MKLPGEAWLEFKISNDNVWEQITTIQAFGHQGKAVLVPGASVSQLYF
jgi:hypothetical protein